MELWNQRYVSRSTSRPCGNDGDLEEVFAERYLSPTESSEHLAYLLPKHDSIHQRW